jgi:hypothetical protein
MLVSTRYQAVEIQRRAGNEWTLHLFGSGDEIELTSIDVRFPLATLYRGTAVPQMPNDQDDSK